MFDLISIGDTVVDTFIPLEDAKVLSDGGQEMLALRFGDKIPVGPSTSLVAGNAANNAVGGARLNLKTAIYTHVGEKQEEEYDLRIVNKFKQERIDTKYITHDKNLPSNHHIVLNFKGERTILIYHQPWQYKLLDFDSSKRVYFTSLGPTFTKSNIVGELINYLERTGAKLHYNPGTFQIKAGVKKFPRLLSLTEVFIVNVEEAKIILGFDESAKIDIKKLLKGLLELGPKRVVITDGGEGSYGYEGDKFYHLEVFPANLLEMTGAGDGYATGVLAGFFYGKDLAEAMRWGAANGASVVEQIGPQAGLLTYNAMLEKLKLNSKIIAKEI